jgi:butyrate kinase
MSYEAAIERMRDSLVDGINKLKAEIESLRKIVDMLPKTADGVPIHPGMKVYVQHHGAPLAVVVETTGRNVELVNNPWGSGTMSPERYFYSTPEGAVDAEIAKEQNQ